MLNCNREFASGESPGLVKYNMRSLEGDLDAVSSLENDISYSADGYTSS